MRVLVLGLLVVVGLAGPAGAQQLDTVPGTSVVVVGVPGLRWSDVDGDTAPALHRLRGEGAAGALSVKALPAVSCPADGWLTLGAGARAGAFEDDCQQPAEPPVEQNLDSRDAADVRALAAVLAADGRCLAGRGDGPALTGADPSRACPVLLVEAPAVGGPFRDVGDVDRLVADVDAARSPGSTLLVVGLSGTADDDAAHLHVALAVGPSFEPGGLRSASTRRAPYVQLVDVAPTVLDLLDVPAPDTMAGQPWQSTGVDPGDLSDLDERAVEGKRAQVPFVVVLLAALLVALAVARARRSWRVAEVAGDGVVGAVAASYVAMLVPWWRAPVPLLALVALSALGVLLRRRAVPVLAAVLVLDLLTGAHLQVDAPFGYSPLVAGRFAGLGNVAFGVLAAAVLLALCRYGARVVAVAGAAVVVVVGAPPFGSDVGGVLALVPAVVLLVLLRAGRRVRLPALAGAGLAGAVVVAGFAVLDWRRAPEDRTHLGRFVEQVRDGTAGTVLTRKAEAIGDLLFANPATALLPVVVAAAVYVVVRPPAALRRLLDEQPSWRHGLLAVGLVSAVGFAVNDSGPAIPALALLVAGPATIARVAGRVAGRVTAVSGGHRGRER